MYRAKWQYFSMENVMELTIYSLAILSTMDTNKCQFQTGLRAVSLALLAHSLPILYAINDIILSSIVEIYKQQFLVPAFENDV